MDTIEQNLASWRTSLMSSIPIGGLLSHNPIAYKWKAPFRCWLLREATFWRVTDLLTQSYTLHQQGHGLGARILLRSGFETVATLIYLNQLMQQVLDGKLNFHLFARKNRALLLGSRDNSTSIKSLNIVTVLEKCEKRYPGLSRLYAILSESAHPSYSGMVEGYSRIDYEEHETQFMNRWVEIYGEQHLRFMDTCMTTFHHEYDDVWADQMVKLESWIVANDAELEATKDLPLQD